MAVGLSRRKRTHEEFVKELEIISSNIVIVSRFVNTKTKIKCKCKIDSHEWEAMPRDLLRGRGCKKCARKIKKNNQTYAEELKRINPNIEIIGTYINNNTPIEFKCKKDGYTWRCRPVDLLTRTGCPKCAGTNKKTHLEFVEEINDINADIEILGEYRNARSKIKVKCKLDGFIWEVKPNNLLNGTRCPNCVNNSKGEIIIEEYCKEKSIKFIQQYAFHDCLSDKRRKLKFDFAILNQEDRLIAVVEYQGKQHYEAIDFFGGQKEFELRKRRDSIKRLYCAKKKLNLIEIPYWIKDIKEYLEERLLLIVT